MMIRCMKQLGLIGLMVMIINCQSKSCKNVVECYAEALQTMQLDREFLRQKVEESSPNTKRITDEIRKDLLSGTLSEKDRKIDELQKALQEQQNVINGLQNQVGNLEKYLKKINQEGAVESEDIKKRLDSYRSGHQKETQEIQNIIKDMIKVQEEQQMHAKSIEDKHDSSEKGIHDKIKENQDQQLDRIRRAEETIKNELGETKQIKEIRAMIKDNMQKLLQIQFNNNENTNSQKELTSKQEQYGQRLAKLEQESGSKDYVDKKVQQIKTELVTLQKHYTENRQSVDGSQKQLNQVYNEQQLAMGDVKGTVEKHQKLLKDAIFKDDIQADLQKTNYMLSQVLKGQDNLKQNVSYVENKNREIEKNQQKQGIKLADIVSIANERGNSIKGEIQKELNQVKDMLYELNKQYEASKTKQDQVEQKSEEIERNTLFNIKKLELFQNETKQLQNEILNKGELQKTFNQIQEKILGLSKQMEQLKSGQMLLEQKQDDVVLVNQKNIKKLQDIQQENLKMESGLKTEINTEVDNLQTIINTFQQNVGKLRADNEVFSEKFQIANDMINQIKQKVEGMMSHQQSSNSNQFEQLQRKEINQQVKMVMGQINEIKNKQQEMQNRHTEMIKQYENQQKLISKQNTDIQQIQQLQKQGKKGFMDQEYIEEQGILEKQYRKTKRLKVKSPNKTKDKKAEQLKKQQDQQKLQNYMLKDIEEAVANEKKARISKNSRQHRLIPAVSEKHSTNDINSIQYKMKQYTLQKGRMGGCHHNKKRLRKK